MELCEGTFLVFDVDEDASGGDDVDRLVFDLVEIGRGRLDEAAAIGDPRVDGKPTAVVEQRARDVCEHDIRAAVQRAEGDEAVPAADVEQRLAGSEPCVVEHPVTHRPKVLEHAALVLGIPSGAASAEPVRPHVAHEGMILSRAGSRPRRLVTGMRRTTLRSRSAIPVSSASARSASSTARTSPERTSSSSSSSSIPCSRANRSSSSRLVEGEDDLLARDAELAGGTVEAPRGRSARPPSGSPSGSRQSRGAHGSATFAGAYDAPPSAR